MVVSSCREGQVYSISVLPDMSSPNAPCEAHFAFLRLLGVPNSYMSPICPTLQIEDSTLDKDIEKGNIGNPKINDDFGNLKASPTSNVLLGPVSLQIGSKCLQLFLDASLMLFKYTSKDKSVTERVHDNPSNRRRYKRTTSFDSRKVAVLFSILSTMGTMILIYLTLRVRQIGDG